LKADPQWQLLKTQMRGAGEIAFATTRLMMRIVPVLKHS